MEQRVKLTDTIPRRTPNQILPALFDGWNFIGVVDEGGDQTEDHFDDPLSDQDGAPVSVREYLGNGWIRAYTWDAVNGRYDELHSDDTLKIGSGIWVYYSYCGICP